MVKFFHLIGNHNNRNFGLTFAYQVSKDDNQLNMLKVTYSVSKCSYREKQFLKKLGRDISSGRLSAGVSFSFHCDSRKEIFQRMLADHLQFETNKHFCELIESWFSREDFFLSLSNRSMSDGEN